MCGGTETEIRTPPRKWGLSPRVRGNLGGEDVDAPAPGSIPACAGEPQANSVASDGNRVYPRVCGGTTSRAMLSASEPGLSPRVRGNPAELRHRELDVGSIPACAGEPASGTTASRSLRVYPRVCGGTSLVLVGGALETGLSPRVRGNPDREAGARHVHGSIPACAGEPW